MAMAGISIGLLLVYGADVAASHGGGSGFLPFDHMARGLGLGLPSIALPIAAFFVARKDRSRGLGCMIAAAGVLVAVGGAAVMAMPDPSGAAAEAGRSAAAEGAPLIGVGAFVAALGALKIFRKGPAGGGEPRAR